MLVRHYMLSLSLSLSLAVAVMFKSYCMRFVTLACGATMVDTLHWHTLKCQIFDHKNSSMVDLYSF